MNARAPFHRRPDGFIERGASVTRLEAFVDAAFAFAVTLLVISLDAIPSSIGAMVEALKGIPAFAASFAQIMLFWAAHASWSRRFGLDDTRSNLLSLLLVFLVLVYVYPLKILFGGFFFWISGGWFPRVASISNMYDLKMMFAIYALAFGTLSLCVAALYRRPLRAVVVPPLDPDEARQLRGEIAGWYFMAIIAAISMIAALLLPGDRPRWWSGLPGMLYALLGFTGVVITRFSGPARAIGR